MSVEETTAALAAFSNAGINGSDAGTSLKTMLTRLIPVTAKAEGVMESYGLMEFDAGVSAQILRRDGIEPLGKSYDDVIQSIENHIVAQGYQEKGTAAATTAAEDYLQVMGGMDSAFLKANGDFEDMATIAGELKTAFGDLSDSERAAALNTLFGSDARRAATILVKEGEEGLAAFIKKTSDLDAAQDLANASTKDTEGAMQRLAGAIETAKLKIGQGLAPAVVQLANGFSDFLADAPIEKWMESFSTFIADTAIPKLKSFATTIRDEVWPRVKALGEVVADALIELKTFTTLSGGNLGTFAKTVGTLVDTFLKLPDPVKKFAVLMAGIQFSGLTTKLQTAGTNLQGFAGRMRDTETRAAALRTGLRNLSGAAGIGMLVQAAGDAEGPMDEFQTTMGGALTGFSVAGPVGLAVGGTVALIADLVTSAEETKPAFRIAGDVAEAYADSLDQISGAATGATRALVLADLQKENPDLLAATSAAGINPKDVISGILGQVDALKRVNAAVRKSGDTVYEYGDGVDKTLREIVTGDMAALTEGFVTTQAETRQATRDAQTWAKSLSGVPKKIVTELENENYEVTKKEIDTLVKGYKGAEGIRTTIIQATGAGKTEMEAKSVTEALRLVDLTRPKPTIVLNGVPRVREQGDEMITQLEYLDGIEGNPSVILGNVDPTLGHVEDVLRALNVMNDYVARPEIELNASASEKKLLGGINIPGLATGGVVTKPTLAVVGEGKEPEAIIPLSQLDTMLTRPAAAPTSGGRMFGDVHVQAHDYQDFTLQLQRRARASAAAHS
jgi:hypothetical protein